MATWTDRGNPHYWTYLASSGDGSKLIGGTDHDYLYISTDFGVTWSRAGDSPITTAYWEKVCSSVDGTILMAMQRNQLYLSTNSGTNWTQLTSNLIESVQDFYISLDGSKLIYTSNIISPPSYPIYISTDYGATWSTNVFPFIMSCIVCDSNFINMAGYSFTSRIGGPKYSSDGGNTWTTGTYHPAGFDGLSSLICNDDFSIIYGVGFLEYLYTSTDMGASWNLLPSAHDFTIETPNEIACSSNGKIVIVGTALALPTYRLVYISANYGSTWAAQTIDTADAEWAVATDKSGLRLVVGGHNFTSGSPADIYTSTAADVVYLKIDIGSQWKSAHQAYVIESSVWKTVKEFNVNISGSWEDAI